MLKAIEKYIFYLNKEVLVKVDRKLGDKHPNFDFIYPVNYGYIPNTLSEDNEEIDAYILGIFYPILLMSLKEFVKLLFVDMITMKIN